MRPLLSTAELAALIDGPNPPVVLDVRWTMGDFDDRAEYRRQHLPLAVFLDLDTELAAEPGEGGRHPLPAPTKLQTVLRAAGVNSDSMVVFYDAVDGSIAARAWWLLRWAGHRAVTVLDGGFAAWTAEGRPVTSEVPSPAAGNIDVHPAGMPVLGAEQASRLARQGVLLDARAPQRYAGEIEPIDSRAGHVPGAVNAPFAAHLGSDRRWRPAAALAEHFSGLGVRPGRPVGAYCGSGVTACSVVLALEHAGLTGEDHPAALYVGSWSHYILDPRRPVATGPAPGLDPDDPGE